MNRVTTFVQASWPTPKVQAPPASEVDTTLSDIRSAISKTAVPVSPLIVRVVMAGLVSVGCAMTVPPAEPTNRSRHRSANEGAPASKVKVVGAVVVISPSPGSIDSVRSVAWGVPVGMTGITCGRPGRVIVVAVAGGIDGGVMVPVVGVLPPVVVGGVLEGGTITVPGLGIPPVNGVLVGVVLVEPVVLVVPVVDG